MSAYLPTSLDAYGMPESFDSTKKSDAAKARGSTLDLDLNETIEIWERKII
jgi:hypothetical protein